MWICMKTMEILVHLNHDSEIQINNTISYDICKAPVMKERCHRVYLRRRICNLQFKKKSQPYQGCE